MNALLERIIDRITILPPNCTMPEIAQTIDVCCQDTDIEALQNAKTLEDIKRKEDEAVAVANAAININNSTGNNSNNNNSSTSSASQEPRRHYMTRKETAVIKKLPRFAGCAALVLVLVRGYMFVAHIG